MESILLNIMDERKSARQFSQLKNPLQQALQCGSIVEIKDILSERYHATFSTVKNDWEQKCREIINICLDKKLAINVDDTKYCALLHFVIKHLDRDFESVINKCEDFDIDALNNAFISPDDDGSLLHFAIENRKQNVVKILIKFGANVNVKNSLSQTPLLTAVLSRQVEMAEMLLKAGADVNSQDYVNMRPINYAFHEGDNYNFNCNEEYKHWELVILLCKYGAHLNFNNPNGSRTLIMACRKGNIRDVEFLMMHGADLFSCDEDDVTAIHSAAIGYNYELVDFLLSRGADINNEDLVYESPIHDLANTSNKIYNVLKFHGDETLEAVNSLWNLDYVDDEVKKSVDMIEFLADNGANVNTLNIEHITPLMFSVICNSPEITECLLELNTNIYNNFEVPYYYHRKYPDIHVETDFSAEKVTSWVLLTAFLALKNIDVHDFTISSSTFHWVYSFFEECKEEVSEMQKRKIWADRKVSFFDFIDEDLMNVTKYFRNCDVMFVLKSEKYVEFPRYRYFFEKRIERVQKMKNCQNVFIRFLKKFFKRNLPSVVIYKIINYLSVGDLRNLTRAFCRKQKSPLMENIYHR